MESNLQGSFAAAEHNHRLAGIRMSTAAKVRNFEEMLRLIPAVGARDQLAGERSEPEPAVNLRSSGQPISLATT
jgi:hypothetical protein